jgi:hypothetical protein
VADAHGRRRRRDPGQRVTEQAAGGWLPVPMTARDQPPASAATSLIRPTAARPIPAM